MKPWEGEGPPLKGTFTEHVLLLPWIQRRRKEIIDGRFPDFAVCGIEFPPFSYSFISIGILIFTLVQDTYLSQRLVTANTQLRAWNKIKLDCKNWFVLIVLAWLFLQFKLKACVNVFFFHFSKKYFNLHMTYVLLKSFLSMNLIKTMILLLRSRKLKLVLD